MGDAQMKAIIEAHGRLLAAEADFLTASGWRPYAPTRPGGDVVWKNPHGVGPFTQDHAVEAQKRYERK